MRGVFLAPKDENIATEFTEFTERRFSSQTQHARRFPSILSGSLWLETEFTEVTERRFSSQTQHRRRFPSILSGSLCSLWLETEWLKTEFTEVTERRFSSQTQHRRRFPSILSVLSVLSVAQISIPLVSNATQGRIQSSRSQKKTLAGDCFGRCAPSQGHFANYQVVRYLFNVWNEQLTTSFERCFQGTCLGFTCIGTNFPV